MPDSSLRVKLYSFLLSSFRFCSPLKNDGRGELHFEMVLNDFLYKRKNKECKLSPDTGKVAAEPSEGASVRRNGKMILTCVRRLDPIASQGSALPSEFGGS